MYRVLETPARVVALPSLACVRYLHQRGHLVLTNNKISTVFQAISSWRQWRASERAWVQIACRDNVTRRFGCTAVLGTTAVLSSDAMPARTGEVR